MSTFYSYGSSGRQGGPAGLRRDDLARLLQEQYGRADHLAKRYYGVGTQYHKIPYVIRRGDQHFSKEMNEYCEANFMVKEDAVERPNLTQIFNQVEWAYRESARLLQKSEAQFTPADYEKVESKISVMRGWVDEAERELHRLGTHVGQYGNTLEYLKEHVWRTATLKVNNQKKAEWRTWKEQLPDMCGAAPDDRLR